VVTIHVNYIIFDIVHGYTHLIVMDITRIYGYCDNPWNMAAYRQVSLIGSHSVDYTTYQILSRQNIELLMNDIRKSQLNAGTQVDFVELQC
jgi:hypothetical protein